MWILLLYTAKYYHKSRGHWCFKDLINHSIHSLHIHKIRKKSLVGYKMIVEDMGCTHPPGSTPPSIQTAGQRSQWQTWGRLRWSGCRLWTVLLWRRRSCSTGLNHPCPGWRDGHRDKRSSHTPLQMWWTSFLWLCHQQLWGHQFCWHHCHRRFHFRSRYVIWLTGLNLSQVCLRIRTL